jgi:hypothetical protein
MESIQPLPARIVARAKQLKIEIITLNFSGGSDEGCLNVDVDSSQDTVAPQDFLNEIENWAWDAYSYSGGGDGSDYGDDITYDLKAGTAKCQDWWTDRRDGTPVTMPLEVDDATE